MRRILFLSTVALVMAVVLASPAWAAPFTVNSTADPGDGTCTTDPNGCTLREAINAANSSNGEDNIVFDLGQSATITLASELPTITAAGGRSPSTEVARISP